MKKTITGILFLIILFNFLEARPVVMLTGYWSPTSEMIYRFSPDPILNPDGWIGENWEHRGYDVYAFFPAFDVYTREFEVDYQATWNDFWARTEEYHPEIIISFGAGDGPWEIETRAINRDEWEPDEIPPYYPTPNPPDSTMEADGARYATLPLEYIRDAVSEQTNLYTWIDYNDDPGDFLCNFIAYLGMWYQNMHAPEDDEYYCRAAGFIHVDDLIDIDEATLAAEVTLRSTLIYFANLTELQGSVIAGAPLENCLVTLTDEDGNVYETTPDENGDFLIEDILFGTYSVTAIAGRYYYYQDEFVLDSHDDFLLIEVEEYTLTDPLTYCQGANELISEDIGAFILSAAYFPTEMLSPYQDYHLNSILFTAPENSDDCTDFVFFYRGNPMENNLSLIQTVYPPDYQQEELVEAWLNDIYFLSEEDLQAGLTIAYGLNSPNNNIGYSDNTVSNPNGNLIRVGQTWYHADEEFDIQGNWDLRLGFYGVTAIDSSEEIISTNDIKLANFPNPFTGSTTISFDVTQYSDFVTLDIYNIKGQKVATLSPSLCHSEIVQGRGEIIWNASKFSSGIYFYRLTTGQDSFTKKMILKK